MDGIRFRSLLSDSCKSGVSTVIHSAVLKGKFSTMEHPGEQSTTTTMTPCRRMQPLFWLCGCPYSAADIPGLPSEFVRPCDINLADEFAAFKDYGEFVMQAQCLNIQIDQSLIPWICPSEHDAIFGAAGELGKYADKIKENCVATSTLLHEVI